MMIVAGFMRMVMVMIAWGVGVVTIHQHTSLTRGDAAAIHGLKDQGRSQVECRGGLLEERRRDADVDESAEQHVAAEAGKAFEIADTHGCIL